MVEGEGKQEPERTEMIPSVQPESTREMPAVEAPVAVSPYVRREGPAGYRFEPSPPTGTVPTAPPPAPEPAPAAPPAPPATVTPSPGGPRQISVRSVVAAVVAVVMVAIIGFAVGKLLADDDTPGQDTASQQQPAAQKVDADVSSFDPSGGSGFRPDGAEWTTQTYNSATFGNLKKGVGLQLDLGQARAVDEVSFTADGATVELRAADSPGQFADGYQKVGESTVADGATTLSGEGGGEHRYWMIWVSKLGQNDGFSATVGDIQVTAS